MERELEEMHRQMTDDFMVSFHLWIFISHEINVITQ